MQASGDRLDPSCGGVPFWCSSRLGSLGFFVCFVLDEVWGFYKCRHPSAAAHPHFMLSVQFFLTNINTSFVS